MNRFITFLLLLFLTGGFHGFAQPRQIVVTGTITDNQTGLPIPDVHVRIKGTNLGDISAKDGKFRLPLLKLPVTIEFIHISYVRKEMEILNEQKAGLKISLESRTVMLPDFSVITGKPEDLIGEKQLFVKDYEFLGDCMLVMAYINRKTTTASLILFNTYGDTISSTAVERAGNLFKDCLGNIHYRAKDTAWQTSLNGKNIDLYYPTPIEEFDKIMFPCAATTGSKYILRDYYYNDQLLLYYYYDTLSKSQEEIVQAADPDKLRMLKDLPRMRSMDGYSEFDERFEQEMMYRPVFAPLILMDDTLCIFNFPASEALLYPTNNFENPRILPVAFQNYKNWYEQVCYDEITGKVYALFRKNGIFALRELNMQTGEPGQQTNIPGFPHVEKIQVHNGFAYFLYKDNTEPEQSYRKLYKMKL
ncbi:MAG: carboxypeptidase-like regulatory domain-containing protein [Bacteroidetes bacterium]|nr:carboxypeptidase-like regulatory domain-containing protein [Bacteroidota bacterium]MBU1720670.1 carboxypeptidase-like regulatory domain-containing protein [Bacteroidota bacterium]